MDRQCAVGAMLSAVGNLPCPVEGVWRLGESAPSEARFVLASDAPVGVSGCVCGQRRKFGSGSCGLMTRPLASIDEEESERLREWVCEARGDSLGIDWAWTSGSESGTGRLISRPKAMREGAEGVKNDVGSEIRAGELGRLSDGTRRGSLGPACRISSMTWKWCAD